MKVRAWHDLLSGALFVVLGAVAIAAAWRLPLGTMSMMGAAAFPSAVGLALLVVGGALVVRSLRSPPQGLPSIAWRPMLVVTASLLLFSFLVLRIGLVVSAAIMLVFAGYASYEPRFAFAKLLRYSVVLAALAALLFRSVLGLPLPLWP